MRLTVAERFAVQELLPKESNFVTLRLTDELRKALSFGEEEMKTLSLKIEGGQATWDPVADGEGADIEVGEIATGIIRKALTDLDKGNKLTAQHVSLYEKFVSNAT